MGNATSGSSDAGTATEAGGNDDGRSGAGALNQEDREWLRVALHELHDDRLVAALLARLPADAATSSVDSSGGGGSLGGHQLTLSTSNNDPSVLYSSSAAADSASSPPSTPPSAGARRRLTREQSRALYYEAEEPPLPGPSTRPLSNPGGGHCSDASEEADARMLRAFAELLDREPRERQAAEQASVLRCPELALGATEAEAGAEAITEGLQARARIYRRIQRAVRNALAHAGRGRLWRSRNDPQGLSSMTTVDAGPSSAMAGAQQQHAEPDAAPTPGSVMMAAAIRMVLTMATQPGADSQASSSLCDALVGLLQECPPEALAALDAADDDEEGEGKPQAAQDQPLETESFGRIARFARDVAESDAPGQQHHALSLLVALGVATGSVASLVDAAHRLLLAPNDEEQLLPAVASFLNRLAAEAGSPKPPAACDDPDGSSFVATSAQALALLATNQERGMTTREVGRFILAHLDRLAAPFDAPPSAPGTEGHAPASSRTAVEEDGSVGSGTSPVSSTNSEGSSPSDDQQQHHHQHQQRRRPFRYDLRPLTFRRLLALVRTHLPYVSSPTADADADGPTEGDAWGPYALLAGLRLLRVNVHQLARHHAARGVRLGPRALRLELLELVMALLDATAGDDGTTSSSGSNSNGPHVALHREALALFVAGVEVFYPDGDAQARLLALHLRHHRASAATPAAGAIRSLLLTRLRDLPAMADLVEGATAASHQRQSAQGGSGAEKKATVLTPPLPLYPAARHRRGSESRGSATSLGSLGSSMSLSTSSSTSHSSTSSPLVDLVGVLMHLSAGASIRALRGQEGQPAASTIAVDDAPAILDTMLLYLVGRVEENDGDEEDEGDVRVDGAGGTMALFLAALVPEAQSVLQAAATATTDPATLITALRCSLVGRLLAPCLTFLWGQATAASASLRTRRLLLDLAASLVLLLRSLSPVLSRLASADEEGQWLRQLEQVVALLGGLAIEAQLWPEKGRPKNEEGRHARWLEEGDEDGGNNALLATLPAPELLGALLPHIGAADIFPAMELWPSAPVAVATSPRTTATAIATPPRPSRKMLVAPRSRPRSLELELLHLPQASSPRTPTAALRQTAKMPGCASPVAVRDPGPLLRQLARSPPGPLAQSLLKRLQSHVPEVRAALQGPLCVSAAIRAAAAALILHNNLTAEAMDLVHGKRSAPSPDLTKAWRQAHRIRQWLLAFKHAGAEDVEDAEEGELAQACADVVHRARWLLAIQPFDEARLQAQLAEEGCPDDSNDLSTSSSLTSRRRRRSHPARGRGCASIDMSDTWSAALAASGAVDDGGCPASPATAATDAAQALRDLLECRRALAAHRGCTACDTGAAAATTAARPAASTSEQVLAFLQSDTRVEDLAAVMRSRDAQACDRTEAFRLARMLLGAIVSPEAKAAAISTITCGLRSLTDGDSASGRVHYLSGLGGAGYEAKAAVRGAFFDVLGEVVGALQTSATEQLQLAGLRLCALDYGPEDHALLHDRRLLPQLQRLMAPPNSTQVRCTARACFKLLLHRCLCGAEGGSGAANSSPATPIPTLFQHALLNAVRGEVEAIGQLASSASHTPADAAAAATAGCLLGSARALRLSPSTLGLQAPASAAPLAAKEHTLTFWLWRPQRPAEPSQARAVYRVVGAEGCLVRATPDLDSPVVTTLDTDTLVEVEGSTTSFSSHPLVQSGRRVRIVAPVCGFGSKFAAMGYTILRDLREEASLRPGDRVCRGPDWQSDAKDEGEEAHGGGLGTVVALTDWETTERRGVVVRWDYEPEGAARTYRYGFMGKYDVVRTTRDESGLLLYKGNEALLSSKEAEGTWTYTGVGLTDSGAVEHLIDAGDKCIRVVARQVVPAERWTHVAVVHRDDTVRIFYNGRSVCDASTPLPQHLRRPCRPRFRKIMQRIESPHPYPNNMNESWTVSIPGASMIRVTFDARTKSEPEFDYLVIYRDESRTETWGAAKYSGGRAGSTSNWPGIGGPPLDVPTSCFIVQFTSDGSNNDWGFAFVAEALVPVYGEESERGLDSEPAELNLSPWYLGQPPAHVTSRRTTPHGYLAGVHVLPTALDAGGLQALMHATTPSCTVPPTPFPEPRAVDTLAILRRSLRTSVGRTAFPTGAVASFLLDCLLPPQEVDSCRSIVPVATRLAALHLAETVLPMFQPAALDARVDNAEGVVPVLLRGAGRVFNVWGDYLLAHSGRSRRDSSGLGASDMAALALAQLAVLRSAADASDAWADEVARAVAASLGSAPALVAALSGPVDAKLDVDTAALDGLLAALCLLGGDFGAPRVGAQVAYAVPQQPTADGSASPSTAAMQCGRGVVLKVKLSSATAKKEGDGGGEQRECVFIILPDGDASKVPIQVPATGVSCLPSTFPNALVQRLVDAASSLLPAFEALMAPDLSMPPTSVGASLAIAALSDLRARAAKALTFLYAHEAVARAYQPLLPALATLTLAPVQAATPVEPIYRTRVIESQHPYKNNTRETIEVHFPGATKLSVAFDEQSRTETGCDVLVFFADHSRQRRWGRDKYSGRDQWPGCGGCPPLEIPAAGFVLSWTTDATNTDWGWRMTVTATLSGLDPRTAMLPLVEQRLYHVTELLQEGPAHLLRHQPPPKSADAPAVTIMEAAPCFPTSMAEQQQEEEDKEEDGEAITFSATKDGFDCHDTALTSGIPSLVGGYDPRHDLKGQTGQAQWGFAVFSYQAAAMRFASRGLLAHLARWPAERLSVPTLRGLFGSMDGFWHFLATAHALEGMHSPAASNGAASCSELLGKGNIARGLLRRAVAVLGGPNQEKEQDVDLACWVLEHLTTQCARDDDLGAVLHADPTFVAIRDRLLLATTSPILRMRLLGLVSLLVQQLPSSMPPRALGGLSSLRDTLKRLLEAQHSVEEDRAAKSPYLQALVQSLVSLASALGHDDGTGLGVGPWFGDIRAAVGMLTEMSKGQLPLRLLAGEFLSRVRAEQGVVVESAHPFNQASERRIIRIPGAPALEVAVDEATQMREQDVIIVHRPGADSPVHLVGPEAHAASGRRVVVLGDALEMEVTTAPTGSSGKPRPASFPGSLKFSSITHSHAVIPPYPALDLDNDFSVELWLRLAPGAARNGRAKCAWSVVLTDGEVAEQQEQQRRQQEQEQQDDEASSASPTRLSPPSSWRQRQQQREREREQQGTPRTVRRTISFSDATGSQDGDMDGEGLGANTEGGWSTEGPLTTGDALSREGSILSRVAAARRAALLSLEPSMARAVDGAALEQLQQMGFPLDVAQRSLEVARNDVRQAVEYCTNGIPNERLFIARGAEALRLMARRVALAEGLAEAAATTPSSVSSAASSTTSPAASSSPSSPSGRGGNRLSYLHAYLSRLSNARGPLSPLPTDAITGLLRPTPASPSSPGAGSSSAPPRRAVNDTNVALGLRVVRGRHWHYEDQDGRGQGTVVGFIRLDRTRATASTADDGTTTTVDNPMLPGWVRVRWDATGTANSYEAGARSLFALSLASIVPGSPQQLRAKADAAAGVRLHWQPPSDLGAPVMTAYRVCRDGNLIHTTSDATECAFHDEAAVAGATHTYAVAGVSTLGEGERSEELEVYVAYARDRRALLKLGVTGEGQLQFLYGAVQVLPPPGGEGIVALNGGGLEEERWTHVAVTFEQSTGQLRLFVDGAQRDARALSGPLATARLKQSLARGKPIYLGALGPDDDHWEGHLHDARFWSAPRPARALRQHAARLPAHAHDFVLGGGSVDPSLAPATYDVVNHGPQRFPSLRIDCPVPTRSRVYYEATLRSGGCLQIGWAGPRYAPAAAYMGIGDDTHSWACDGLRQMKWHGVSEQPNSHSPDGPQQQQHFGHGVPYGGPQSWLWKAGDTIGCLLDADAGVMRFTHNGRDLGLAFTRQQLRAGRYRIEGPEPISCYAMPRAEPGDRLPLRLPPGMVVHATQAEEDPSGDGSVWLRVRQGWIQQQRQQQQQQQQQREEGGTTSLSEIVRLLHRCVAPPDGWYAGTPERCLLLRRFAPDAWMPREAAALPPVGMIITEHGLERRGGDSDDEDEDDGGARDGRAVLAPGIEVDGAAVDVVTFLLTIDSHRRRPSSQDDAGAEEDDEDLDACAGLVLGDCELLTFPKALPPLLEIHQGGRLLAEVAMPMSPATPAPAGPATPARFHLSACLRKSDGHVAIRLVREGVDGHAAASAQATLPSFFEGHELGPVGVVLRPTEPLLGFPDEEEDGDGDGIRRPSLAIRSLAAFASAVESPLDDSELRALEPRMRALQAARASEPVWGSGEAVEDDEGDEKEATAWEGLMPAMSCSEDEGLVFNLGHQPFRHPPPTGFQSIAAAALEAATRKPTVPPPTLALQIFDPERSVWETVHSARRGHRLLRAAPRPEGEEAEEASEGEEQEARLMGRFLLAEGRGYAAANAVSTYPGALADSDAALPFPAAALHGTLWDVDARSPAAEGGPLWGWRLIVTPWLSPAAPLPRLRPALVAAAADAEGTVAEPAAAGGPLDAQLVRYINATACKRGLGASALLSADWAALVPEHKELVAWPLLAQAMAGAGHRYSAAAPQKHHQQGWEEAKDSRESHTPASSTTANDDDDVLASMCLLPAARSVADLNQTVATRARVVEDDDLDGSVSESARRREWAVLGGAVGRGPVLLSADPSKGLPRRLALGAEGDSAAGAASSSSSSSSSGPCALVVSVLDHPGQEAEPLCISGVWTVGANPTDLLGVVIRTTGHCWGSGPLALGLADGLACCLRPVDGSLHLLAQPFVPGRERYPMGLGSEQCVAYLGAEEVAPGARVAFQVTDDGARVTFAVTVLGPREEDYTPVHSARLALRCPAAQHSSGSSRVAFVRLAEEASEEGQGWVRIVCTDPRGATLRDGVSIDTGEPVGRLPQGAVARYTARTVYESPDEMQDVCEPVVRFRLEGTPTRPGGWVSERGRYGRNPYPIAERLVFPLSSSSAAPTLAHLRLGTGSQPQDAAATNTSNDDDVKPQRLAPRFRMLRAFNTAVLAALPYVDLACAPAAATGRSDDSSIAALVASSRHLLFSELKMELWDAALEATATPLDTPAAPPRDLQLSRPLAARHRASGEPDTEARHSLWGQAFQQLRRLPGAAFRLRTGQALYHTVLAGEMAHDAGGPYRETLATFCEELQSGALPLLLRCPNAVHNAGRNRDTWVPHPAATSSLALEQFAFLGRLMGLAARTRQYLELGFPSLVWKQLVGQPLVREDLEGVDTLLVRGMDSLRAIEAQGITADMFQEVIYETFTTLTTDDRTVELKPGGASIPVTFHTRFEFADLVEAYRLNEFRVQVHAIRTGLTQVLPARLLPLLTWEELEALVCGSPEVDVDLLEECTEYNACSPEQNHVKWFWEVLREDFTPAERALFVRFVWGRSRLPLSAEQFRQRFKLQAFHRPPPPPQAQGDGDAPTEGSPDTYLPVAHTCFFSLELPHYSSRMVCAERLRYAIHHCVAIDADETALGRRAASLGWDG